MTLTEFLLERIDEDQRRAESQWAAIQPDMCSLDAPILGSGALLHLNTVRDECDSRRLLIWSLRDLVEARTLWSEKCLRYLAVPYADHPDYEDDWR